MPERGEVGRAVADCASGLAWCVAAAVVVGGCGEPAIVSGGPAVRLEGQYVRYVDWGSMPLCETIVDELDEVVEQTAAFLELEALPELSIVYRWQPEATSETLRCSRVADGCAREGEEDVYIFSLTPGHVHELVHAVHLLGLPGGSQIVREGLAEYLGSGDGTYLNLKDRGEFVAAFSAVLARGAAEGDAEYTLAQQFVGGLIERGGVAAFKEFWALTTDGGVAAAYEAVYADTFDEGLAAIAAMEVRPRDETAFTTCDGTPLAWPASGVQTWTLQREDACLDRFGVRSVPDGAIYSMRYRARAPTAGTYQLRGPAGLDTQVYVRRCGAPETRAWVMPDGLLLELEAAEYVFEVVSRDVAAALGPVTIGVVTP